ncbi:MAG: hypothetical protein DRP68_05550, partial [Candidatus Omnitrophota bacterium]
MSQIKSNLVIITSLIVGLFLFPFYANTAQIERTQATTATFGPYDTTIQNTLPNPVDLNTTFLISSTQSDDLHESSVQAGVRVDGGEGMGLFQVNFEDDQTVNFERVRDSDKGTFNAKVSACAVEFNDGVNVYSGITTFANDTYVKNISLPTLQGSSYFPILSVKSTEWFTDETEAVMFKATFPDNSTLHIERKHLTAGKQVTTAASVTVAWQVVEILTDATVQKGEVTIPGDATTATVTLPTPITDINKAFLIFNYTGGDVTNTIDGIDAQMMVRGTITDANTLTFTRGLAGTLNEDEVYIAWYLIELTDSSSYVQKGTTSFLATDFTKAITINSVDPARSFPIVSVAGGASTSCENLHNYMVRAEITDSTTLTLERTDDPDVSEIAVDADWFVVELSPLTLKTPNGGELWRVGETHDITWKHAAALETGGSQSDGTHSVDLLLSTDSGATFPLTIVSGISAASDSYSWTIPATIGTTNLISNQLRVRIIDTDLTERNYDDSNADFEIKGTLTLTAPNGGEIWYIGDTDRYITWDYTGELGTVALYYDTNSGADGYPNLIASGVSVGSGGSGSYNWNPIPDLPYKTIRVKVEAESDTTVFDTSSGDFEIRPNITITAPNLGTEVWPAQTDQSIEWTTTGTVDSVNIYYSTNTGVDWTLIVSDYTLGSPYTWTVPVEAIGDQTKIKVEKSDDSVIMDTAPDGGSGVFSIVPSIKVTSPTSGTEVWRVGESHDITWEINGTIDYVKIEYSTDGGSTYPVDNLIVDSTPASDLSYPWTIPDNISDNVVVKISNVDDPSMYDESDNPFKIKGKIVITEPNGGETYTVGSSQVIKWQKYGTLGDVNIKYSTDGGTTFPNTIATVLASDLNYTWSPIPDDITDTARIKIELVDDPAGVFDTSDADFYIKGSLSLTAPNGGEIFYVGDSTDISWTYTGTIGNVELRYSTDGGATFPDTKVIVSGIAPDSSPYSWTIPDDISSSVRVKVLLVSDPTVNDISDGDFSIKGNLVLTAPNGGEEWEVETYQNITWDRLGESLGYVKLEYSVNDGADGYPYLIADNVDSGELSYSWLIPDAIGNQVKVKITSMDDPDINDTSDNVFSIKGRFSLSAPTGGETWYVGTQENISWTTYGSIDKVNLYYSTDGGATYSSTIATALSNTDGYLWTIPDAIGTQTRVKVENYYDSSVYATSPGDFTIKGRVIVTAPNGGEVWRVGETKNITWEAYGSIGNVEIRYSTDGGTTYPDTNVITPAGGVAATDGSFAWTVPDAIGTNLKVKIISLDDSTVYDESDNVFEIKGTLTLTAPDGGEIFYVGDTTDITWTKTGTLGSVELRYSTDGGATYPDGQVIATGIDAETGTPYTWTIPDAIGTQLKVKVLLTSDPTGVYDESNDNFTIKGKLHLDAPNGGEIWEVASSQNITWTRTGSIAYVKLEYSTDGGITYPNLIVDSTDAAVGSYTWTIPDAIGTALRVKVTDTSDATVYDTSDDNFTIKGKLVLTYPNGGETFIVGSSYDITWNTYGTIPKVNLYYSTDGGGSYTSTITTGLDNTGTYSWTVPDAIGTQTRIKVENYDDSTVFDTSDGDFTIKGSITVTSPNGGEVWIVDDTKNITWQKTGSIGNVEIRYSVDGGTNYPDTQIITPTGGVPSSDLAFAWTIPDEIGANLKIKITSLDYPDVVDESDDVFEIKGSIALTAPNGGEAWEIGTTQDITWTKTGSIGNIEITYSDDGGATYPYVIDTSVDSSLGTYSWAIPDNPTTSARVKVTSLSDSSVSDASDLNFRIKGVITVTAPNGGEVWIVGSTQNITWDMVGSIESVNIDYSTDSGDTFPNVIASGVSATSGSYAWDIPDDVSTTVRVRVTDANDATVTDYSDADFSIKPSITLTYPVGGEVLVVDSTYDITWSMVGTIANIKLEYSTDGGSTYPYTIISSTPAAALSYSWTVPDTISNTCMMRISDAGDSTVNDTSDAYFKIRGDLTVTQPNGGEAWQINTTQDITWTKVGSIATVKLE